MVSIKLPEDIIESARIISAINDETMTDLISGILRPILARMEKEALARRAKRRGPDE